jgi:hypothetical protein
MTYKANYRFIILLFLNLTFIAACEKESDRKEQETETTEETVPDYPPHPKKGFGIVTKNADWDSKLEKLNVSWHYSWGHELKSIQPDSIEFVPMIWGAWSDTTAIQNKLNEIVRYANEQKVHYLLDFNEPDNEDQSNMPVERAIAYWPKLMATGLPLGSPGCVHADREWMQKFMEEIEKRKYRVDFVCVHWYGGANAQSLVNYLNKIHELYKRPIWITEFAPADWDASSVQTSNITKEKAANFMKDILPELDKLDFVHRYAWFSAKTTNAALGNSALFYDNGNLSPLGKYYRDYR